MRGFADARAASSAYAPITGEMEAMHVAESSMPRPRAGQPVVLIAVIAGVTWLAMMGAYVSSYVLGHPVELIPKTYAVYDMTEVAPTSYGSMSIASADLTSDGPNVIATLSLR